MKSRKVVGLTALSLVLMAVLVFAFAVPQISAQETERPTTTDETWICPVTGEERVEAGQGECDGTGSFGAGGGQRRQFRNADGTGEGTQQRQRLRDGSCGRQRVEVPAA